jgi:leucyl aminopeptidase
LNLKPTGGIENMHLDMSGCAAVLGTLKAVAASKLPINLVVAVALAENAIGPNSVKPHTIIPTHKGSVEINNTGSSVVCAFSVNINTF